MSPDHLRYMDLALEQARAAARHGDVPVGAVLVTGPLDSPRLIALGRNRRELDGDPTAHAEVDVLRRAAAELHAAGNRVGCFNPRGLQGQKAPGLGSGRAAHLRRGAASRLRTAAR